MRVSVGVRGEQRRKGRPSTSKAVIVVINEQHTTHNSPQGFAGQTLSAFCFHGTMEASNQHLDDAGLGAC